MKRCPAILTLTMLLVVLLFTPHTVTTQGDPAACELPPVELPLFDATPASEIEGADAPPASIDDPAREATDEEVSEFTAAVEVIVACINTGDNALANAVFTERYLASWFGESSVLYQPDFESKIDQPVLQGVSREPLVIDNIGNVAVRDDGRMSGTVELSTGGSTWADTLVLAKTGDHWLIDDVILDLSGE
jgi:hypothetical protein